MAAPRTTSVRALRTLSQQSRQLHMTGPATFPSPLLTSERPALNLPRDIAGLRAECLKRKLPATGSKSELMARLSAEQMVNSREFSTAVQDSKRPTAASSAETAAPVRHFNTSRELKAVNDSSTIDFAYFPDFDPDAGAPIQTIRVPLLPQDFESRGVTRGYTEAAEQAPMRPEIMTVAADSTHIYAPAALSDVTDNNSIDFQGMAAAVKKKVVEPVDHASGMMRTLWDGLVDDIFGPKQAVKKA